MTDAAASTAVARAHARGRRHDGVVERARFEARRAGVSAFAIPPLLSVLGVLVIAIQYVTASPINHLAGSWVEAVLPLGAAISTSMLVGTDPALELQLSLPEPYRRTLAWRAMLCVAWSAAFDAVFAAAVTLSGIWTVGVGRGEVSWIVTTAVLVAFGALFSGLLGDGRSGAVAAGGLWVAQEGLKGWFEHHRLAHPFFLFATSRFEPGVTSLWTNRAVLAGIAMVLAGAAWAVLGRSHRLFRKAD